MEKENYSELLAYVREKQSELTHQLPLDVGTKIGLPYPFVSPTSTQGMFEADQFYWDSYFIIEGLLALGDVDLARGMVENFAFLCKKFDIIPLRNTYYNLGSSQPPFFTSMIRSIYEYTQDESWLLDMMHVAEREYELVWMNKKKGRVSLKGLNRYCDQWFMHGTAEHESGWDMTSRFDNRCLDILPIDLNSLLYKYECDFAWAFDLLGYTQKAEYYSELAKKRKYLVAELCWHNEKGLFFDFDTSTMQIRDFVSVATFFTLWSGLATQEQATRLVQNLSLLETDGGLVTTQAQGLFTPYRQWDYPNAWPNLQYIAVAGLNKYGFTTDAKRIAKKWLDLNQKVFLETNELYEKYDGVALTKGKDGRYPTQVGFGWTNAVVALFANYLRKESFK